MRAAICGALLLLGTGGCTTWRAHERGNASEEDIGRARVILRDGTALALRDVVVRRDSVIGFASGGRVRMAFGHEQVSRIDTRHVSAGRTIGLVLGSAAAVLVLYAIALAKALSDGFTAAPAAVPSVP
jgi:hypothetical protein